MAVLNEFRDKPGTRLRYPEGGEFMVLGLCGGMLRGDYGGPNNVPIVSLETGWTSFEQADTVVVFVKDGE